MLLNLYFTPSVPYLGLITLATFLPLYFLSIIGVTLGWGESYKEQEIQLNSKSFREEEFKGDVEFYLEPAQHWSAREIFDKNEALWGTFIIKTKIGDICFIGDSGYNDTLFKEIGKKHNIDENKFIIPEIGEFFLFDKNDL